MNEDRSRQRLGRGLASLIGPGLAAPSRPAGGYEAQPKAPSVPAERTVPIDRIVPNPHNPRRSFDEGELEDLATSIRVHGVVQPLLLRPRAGRIDSFEIVAGERRWRAAKLAGLDAVPAVLRDINDRQSLEIAIIENIQRTDLNAVEEALGYQTLIDEHGYTQNDLAEILGKSRSHVANTLRLLKLPEAVRAMIVSGQLSAGAARTVVTADNPVALAERIVAEGLSVREAEALAREPGALAAGDNKPANEASERAPREKDGDLVQRERWLSDRLGLPVAIKPKGKGGSLRIDFTDRAQLEAILSMLRALEEDPADERVRAAG
ncbi:ParB/RepB/Spo0J family partition protein [Aurantimonas sp. VKM B-3413]|uniref:ParB/RepB/Spo0J family partition protein n=1 Tax=Aurantimonas sp. VKM B-3413 TaxID=2779401 RepID=UPI001E597EBE|nr:ParB/RepB/Spo0J family partition protein [Aurantimonas sp. VKM B-3413]MCB8840555.1 ParB/RepB/Spo0J family partition protein [Aurantimonas sp. VKM B-3413]